MINTENGGSSSFELEFHVGESHLSINFLSITPEASEHPAWRLFFSASIDFTPMIGMYSCIGLCSYSLLLEFRVKQNSCPLSGGDICRRNIRSDVCKDQLNSQLAKTKYNI